MTTAPMTFEGTAIRPAAILGTAGLSPDDVSRRARDQLAAYIERGRANAADVVERVLTEAPRDRYVPTAALRFRLAAPDSPTLLASIGGEELAVHAHALDQTAERAGLRLGTLHDLLGRGEPWAVELAAHNLNTMLDHMPARFLVREVGQKIRAVLSDSYRRIDSRPSVEAMIAEAEAARAVIVDGIYSETRVSLKVLHAEPVEVFPNEWMVFGFDYSNSDYGDGAHEISAFLLRLWCLNGAVSARQVRRVHLGRRFAGDAFSERTLRLDAAAQASATRDEVRALLNPAAVVQLADQVRRSNEQPIDPDRIESFLKPRLNKTEAGQVTEKFASADIVELPPGQTTWRFSNALSWLAKNTADGRRRMELERIAGEVLHK